MSRSEPTPLLLFIRALLGLLLLGSAALPATSATVKQAETRMGSRFELTAVHADRDVAIRALELAWAEIDRLEAMISSWRPTSETSRIIAAAGREPVVVSPELYGLIHRSLKVSELTDGAFDITFAGAGDLWDFSDASATTELPDPAELAGALARIDWRRVKLDPKRRSVQLEIPGARIGFGAIGKGFAANRAARVLRQAGIESGVVNAGGDLYAFGLQESGEPWSVAIADPLFPDRTFAHLEVTGRAVVTSGDYESFVQIDGVRYSHILDPRTGWPVRGLRSATVICPDAELADALATSVSVLGPAEGLRLIDRLEEVEAILVTEGGEMLFSRHLETLFTAHPGNGVPES